MLDLAVRDLGRFDKPTVAASVVVECLGVLLHLEWPERRGRLEAIVGAMPRVPDGFATAEWYSRLHVEIVDRVVLAAVQPRFGRGDEPGPAAERASRRGALGDLRARLVEWGQPGWDPRPSNSSRARPGHADAP